MKLFRWINPNLFAYRSALILYNFFLKLAFNLWHSSRNILIGDLIRVIKIYRSNIINIIARIVSRRMMIFICSIYRAWIFFSTFWFSALFILWRDFLDHTRAVQLFLILVIKCTIMFLEYIIMIFRYLILWILKENLIILLTIVINHVLKIRVACKISNLLQLHILFVLIYNFKLLL